MSVARFRIVDTFTKLKNALPGLEGGTGDLQSGDICYCSENNQLYYIGDVGTYSKGAIFSLPDDFNITAFLGDDDDYDSSLIYKFNNQFYTYNGSQFIELGGGQEISISPDNLISGSGAIKLELDGDSLKASLRAIPTASNIDGKQSDLRIYHGVDAAENESREAGTIKIFTNDSASDGGVYISLSANDESAVNTIHLVTDKQTPPKKHTSQNAEDYGASSITEFGHARSLSAEDIGTDQVLARIPLVYGAIASPTNSDLLGIQESIFAKVDHTHQLPSLEAAYGIATTIDNLNGISSDLINFTKAVLDDDPGSSKYLPVEGADENTPAKPKFSEYLEKIENLEANVIYNLNNKSITNTQALGTSLAIPSDKQLSIGNLQLTQSELNLINTSNPSIPYDIFTINKNLEVGTSLVTILKDLQVSNNVAVGSFKTTDNVFTIGNNKEFVITDGIVKFNNKASLLLDNTSSFDLAGILKAEIISEKFKLYLASDSLYIGNNTNYYINSNGSTSFSDIQATTIFVNGNVTVKELTFNNNGTSTISLNTSDNIPVYQYSIENEDKQTEIVTFLTNYDKASDLDDTNGTKIPTVSAVKNKINTLDSSIKGSRDYDAGNDAGQLPIIAESFANKGSSSIVGINQDGYLYPTSLPTFQNNFSDSEVTSYSCKYITDNFVQKSLITKKYLVQQTTGGKFATTQIEPPSFNPDGDNGDNNYLSLTGTINTEFNYAADECLTFPITFDGDTTVSYNDAITVNLAVYTDMPGRTVEYGAKIIGPDGTTEWNSGKPFGSLVLLQGQINNIKFDIDFENLTSATQVASGNIITVKIFIRSDSSEMLNTYYYCGKMYNNSRRYSYVEINYNGVYLNTNQISDRAITMTKLSTELVDLLDSMESRIQTSIQYTQTSVAADTIPYFRGTSGKVLQSTGILYTDIMVQTSPVYIVKAATDAISDADKAKFLIDSSDSYILKYYKDDTDRWTPVVVAWA